MLINYLRNILFWFLDSIKGGYIRNMINQIKEAGRQPESSNSENLKKKYIDKLLIHATNSTPYYSSYKNFNSIQDFPVINKVIIQQNFDKFQSTKYKDKDNFKVSTSGSTGVPFFLYQDKNKRRRNHSDVIYFLKESGFKIGNRLYELEVWRGHNEKDRLKAWLQNTIQFDISKLTDKRIESFIELLKNDKQSKKTMLGFASSYEMIAQYMERNNIFLDRIPFVEIVVF